MSRICDKIEPDDYKKGWTRMEKMALLIMVLVRLAGLAIGWVVSCGVFWLIALCFGWEFSWAWGTGL